MFDQRASWGAKPYCALLMGCSTVHPLDIVYQYGALPYDFCGLVQNIKDLGMYV